MTMRDGNKCPEDACVIFKRCAAPGQCKAPEPLCKADGKPLCEPCWREGRCMGEVTWDFRSDAPKRWRSAEAAAYGRVD
jgi:hypothetical protein